MKKCFHIITGLDNGGAEAVLFNFCLADKANYHIVVSLMDDGKYGSLLRDNGIEVLCLGQNPARFSPSAFLSLYKFIKSRRPDVVQTWMFHADLVGGLSAWLAGVNSITWGIHHTTFDATTSWTTRFVFYINKWLSYFVPDNIICCSKASVKHMSDSGFSNKKLIFAANGYDLARFYPDKYVRDNFRKELGFESHVPVLCMVGRFHPQKDHENLLLALAKVLQAGVNFHCLCIGPGVDESNHALVAVRENLGLRNLVQFIGPSNNIPNYLAASDLFILPSAFGEAFPNVLNEAMACGVPCVTTDVGDAAYIVGDIGWVSPPKDPEALAGKILEAIAAMGDSEAYTLRRIAARKRISENFSIQAMITNYHKAWGVQNETK